MAVSQVVALRGPGGLALDPPAALLGLAFERRASWPGPRRGVAQKRRELRKGPGIRRARHGSLPAVKGRSVFCMAAVMIGVDPHKASHTAVAVGAAEEPLGELRVRACVAQTERLLAWGAARPQRARGGGG